MTYVLNHDSRPYAKLFEDISAVPRGSFKEDKIATFVVEFAKNLGLEYTRDDMHNVVVRKEASLGYEDHEPVILQGHMDMIWAKIPGSTFDFETQPLDLYVTDDGFVKARETTCGSDNGKAVAYMLAVLQDDSLNHPPLECVFTAAEEPGIFGALALDTSQLKGTRYICMDGNREGTSVMIASGGLNGDFIKEVKRVALPESGILGITVDKLTGGHAQTAQADEIANAVKVMARILYNIKERLSIRLVSIDGGAVTTIPTNTTAVIALGKNDILEAKSIIDRVAGEVKFEHKDSDPNMKVEYKELDKSEDPIANELSDSIIDLLYILPVGLINTSLVYEGIPTTSIALEVIETEADRVVWRYKPQSSLTSKVEDMEKQTQMYAKLFDTEYKIHSMYYGHDLQPDTPLYNTFNEVWYEMTGEHIKAIGAHYGNEVGTFLRKMPQLDAIVLSPTHYDAHTPNERLDLESFDRCYECLVKILERL